MTKLLKLRNHNTGMMMGNKDGGRRTSSKRRDGNREEEMLTSLKALFIDRQVQKEDRERGRIEGHGGDTYAMSL